LCERICNSRHRVVQRVAPVRVLVRAHMKKRVMVDSDNEEDNNEAPGEDEERAGKRSKKEAKTALEHEYVCPITQELFVDPVTAEDGRVYERTAIVRAFNESHETTVMTARSPMTNAPMGKQLYPAHQVKGALEALIDAGVLKGERVETWKEVMLQRDKDRKKVNDLKRRCDEGDATAAMQLGFAYDKGLYGLTKNPTTAFSMHKKATYGGCASAATRAGILLIKGRGVPADEEIAMRYLFCGAILGSEHACEHMGHSYAEGINGCEKDEAEALIWYKKMRTCECKDSVEYSRQRAQRFLADYGVAHGPVNAQGRNVELF